MMRFVDYTGPSHVTELKLTLECKPQEGDGLPMTREIGFQLKSAEQVQRNKRLILIMESLYVLIMMFLLSVASKVIAESVPADDPYPDSKAVTLHPFKLIFLQSVFFTSRYIFSTGTMILAGYYCVARFYLSLPKIYYSPLLLLIVIGMINTFLSVMGSVMSVAINLGQNSPKSHL